MSLLTKLKFKNIFRPVLKSLAEIVIIFLGITISFLFEQWREENQERKELIELTKSLLTDAETVKARLISDLKGTEQWLGQLDSLRADRESNTYSTKQLTWFYSLIIGKEFGLFDPNSPAYLSAVSSGMIDKLPDSVQSQIYSVYQTRLRYFQFLYNQQQESITHFRNNILVPANTYLFHQGSSSAEVDLKKLAIEMQRPIYGNFINQIISTENVIYKRNLTTTKSVERLIEVLLNYLNALETE